ncbi:hypothetical protein GGQ22_10635 [Nocardioides sp. zg-579]|uniref:Peptidase MA-like domain-containing protein n=1 Tax=Nocardioides marmotae TaxID=2663857 RepID=A0A6I3JBT4_9ACTN|nr:hypothetical protein [Nocardioides marmotae]MCR6031901.1 hypothetical protein [Gordonia jinghuaiqii]MTB95541.1 hypothetical protein [Nocardioides marmotae]QKE00965.1 hypothetical protein HPC71_07695 [Nocardioides marmotae]
MAGLVAFAVLVAAAVAGWLVLRDEPYVATPEDQAAAAIGPRAVDAALDRLEEAVAAGDAAALAGAPAGIARNAARLRVRDLDLRYVDTVARTDDSLRAAVDVTWRFGGFDARPARTEVEMTFTADGAEAVLTSVGGGEGRSPLWLTGPVEVLRSERVLVVGATGTDVASIGRHAEAAVPVVRRVLAGWRSRLVVEVPASAEGLGDVLGAEDGQYDAVAAVTAAPDGSVAPDAPLHVFVNPDVLGTLGARGAQVVMSHEATHVATRAPVTTQPLWLLEGFADYVALRDVGLPLTTTAGQVIEQVREDGLPRALPGPAEFDTATTHLGATYEAAWLACVVLADRVGETRLVDLYRAAGRTGLEEALRDVAGWSEADLVRAWRSRLADLAGLSDSTV